MLTAVYATHDATSCRAVAVSMAVKLRCGLVGWRMLAVGTRVPKWVLWSCKLRCELRQIAPALPVPSSCSLYPYSTPAACTRLFTTVRYRAVPHTMVDARWSALSCKCVTGMLSTSGYMFFMYRRTGTSTSTGIPVRCRCRCRCRVPVYRNAVTAHTLVVMSYSTLTIACGLPAGLA